MAQSIQEERKPPFSRGFKNKKIESLVMTAFAMKLLDIIEK